MAISGDIAVSRTLLFAAAIASAATALGFFRAVPGISRTRLWLYFFLAAASHGLLDALTNGGLGVAFFSPFDNDRFFLPWRPIEVSPIVPARFFSARGLSVLASEFLWIWIPSGLVALAVLVSRRFSRKSLAAG